MSKIKLETKRLLLRPALKKDVPVIAEHLSNPLIAKTTLHIPFPYSRKDAEIWFTNNALQNKSGLAYTFVITMKRSGKLIGSMGLHPTPEHNRAEAGYWIAVPYWNKGIATEALQSVLQFGFEQVGLHKIYATHMLNNKASGRVMQKVGMKREGKLIDHYKKQEEYVSIIQYGMIRNDYNSATKKIS